MCWRLISWPFFKERFQTDCLCFDAVQITAAAFTDDTLTAATTIVYSMSLQPVLLLTLLWVVAINQGCSDTLQGGVPHLLPHTDKSVFFYCHLVFVFFLHKCRLKKAHPAPTEMIKSL